MKKTFKWAGYVSLPIIILLLAALLKWETISYYALSKVVRHYAEREHVVLDIGSISGNPLSKTTFENFSLRPETGRPQTYNLKVQSLTCTYNLWNLRDGYDKFLHGLNCTIRSPEISYDFRSATSQEQSAVQSERFILPAVLPGFDVHSGTVILTGSGWDAEAREINSSLRTISTGQELHLETERFLFNQQGTTRIDSGIASLLRYSDDKLIVDTLDFGKQKVSAAGVVDLSRIEEHYIDFGSDFFFDESKISVSGAVDNKLLKAQLSIDSFAIGELQKRLGGSGWDISGIINGKIDLVYNFSTAQNQTGSFSFGVQGGQVHGVPLEDVSLKGSIDEGFFNVSLAEIRTSGNHVNIKDAVVPSFLLHDRDALAILAGVEAKFGGEIKDIATILQLIKIDKDEFPEIIRPDLLSINGRLDKGTMYLDHVEAVTPDSSLTIYEAIVSVPLLYDRDALAILAGAEAKFGVKTKDFATVLKLIKVEKGSYPEVFIPDSLIVNGYLQEGKIYLDDTHVKASNTKLVINRAKIPIPATVEAFEAVPIEVTAESYSSNIQEIISGLSGVFPLHGQAAADISITGSLKELQGIINFSGEDLRYKDLQLGTLALRGELRVNQDKPGERKKIQFIANEMSQTNDSGTMSLLAPAKVSWQQEMFSIDAIVQLDGHGEADISVKSSSVKEISAKISTRNFDSDGWLGNFLDKNYFFNGADIEAFVTGLPQKTQVELVGSVGGAGGKGIVFPMSGSFALQYSSKGIKISDFNWKSHEKNQLILTGFLPYDPMASAPFLDGEMLLDGHIDFPVLEGIGLFLEPLGISKGSLSMDMNLTGSWKQPLGRIFFKADGVEPPNILKQHNDSPLNITCDLTATPDAIVLNTANFTSNEYSAQAKGSWQHGLSVKELLQKRNAELKGEVVADASVKINDPNFLRKMLPWLRRLEGDIQGEIHMEGAANDPAITGSFSVKDGEASHTFNFPILSAVNLLGEFDGHSITIQNMQAEVGGSPVSLLGNINKENETVAVNLHVNGKNVLLFRNNDMRMRGDVQLDISGPLERLMIKGTTGMTGGYYTRNIDFLGMIGSGSAPVSEGSNFLFSFTDPPLRDAVLDIKITTIEPFKVRNNLIRGVLRPELFLKGTGELPFLLGTVYIDSSRVLLPSGGLQIQSGLLRFLEGKPDRPQLNILAQSKVLGYDINVTTRGPLDDPVITLSSSPALPSDDLMLLLLTGQPPKQDVAGGTESSGTANVMVYLGRDFLNKWLEDESGAADETILDRFELDFGRSVTKSGEQTVDSTFRLSEETTGTGKIFYLTGEKDKYDAINYGLKLVFRLE